MHIKTSAVAFVVVPAVALAGPTATFTKLGSLTPATDPPSSAAFGISPDGLMVVGGSWVVPAPPEGPGVAAPDPNFVPFRWTSEEGLVEMPIPENALPAGAVTRSSNLGEVMVGHNGFTVGADYYEPRNAAIWLDASEQFPDAVVLDLGYFATDVTPDGSIVAGVSRVPGPFPKADEAFRWTEEGGIEQLGVMPGGFYSWGRAVSDDGATVVGYGDYTGVFTAMKWTEGGGMVPLVDDPQEVPSGALVVSADGSIIGGHIDNQLTRWTPNGVENHGTLDGAPFISLTMDANADASVIVGAVSFFSEFGLDDFAFIWEEGVGMRYLEDMLERDHGMVLEGWTLQTASGISADGRTIVGWGLNPSGHTEGWVITLPPPVPPSCDGDLDGDGDTDSADLNILLGDFGCADELCEGDLDGDGDTDSGDLNVLLGAFGVACD